MTIRDNLQCVGVAALLIACKYEEVYFPELHDFTEITDNAFDKSQILKKENEILGTLEFNVTFPSALRFFELYNIVLKLEGKDKSSVLYLLEISTIDYSMLEYKPSLIAAACVMFIVYCNSSLKNMLYCICNQNVDDINKVFRQIVKIYTSRDNGSKSLMRKFAQEKYHQISNYDLYAELTRKNFGS